MEKDEIEHLIRTAIKALELENPKLPLEKKVGERALVGRLAFHLAAVLKDPELAIDTEYNIDPNGDRKWLEADSSLKDAARKLRRKVYEDDSIVVIPDIILHKRGTNERNVAVIEVKFNDASLHEFTYVKLKLAAFQRNTFEYTYGVLVSVPRSWLNFSERSIIEFF